MLKVLEKPFSTQLGLEQTSWLGRRGAEGQRNEGGEEEEEAQQGAEAASSRMRVPYDSKPPVWANEICVT